MSGINHEYIHGRVLKAKEKEDVNHKANYVYLMEFDFFVKEYVVNHNIVDANKDKNITLVLGEVKIKQ